MTPLAASSRRRLKLRKFPFPYKAALTILSDRHGIQTADEFRLFHRFLNTTSETSKGKGLGLEIGDTFWFYDELGNFSYFDKYTNHESAQAALIRDYYAAGYIDCLHTWGDYSNVTFERKYAEWAVDECAKRGMVLPIWVNHGNVRNTQNINRGISHHQGATVGSASYHYDLLSQAGVRVIWRFLTPVIGQDRRLTLGEHLSVGAEHASSRAAFVSKRVATRALMGPRRTSVRGQSRTREYADNCFLRAATLDNNERVHEFVRFNNHPHKVWHGAYVPDLLRQLQPDVLDELTRSSGYMVVYNHLEYGDFYHPDIVAVLRDVQHREQEGDIWVTTAAKLIRYNLTYHDVQWQEEESADKELVIKIAPQRPDLILGAVPMQSIDLQGITFEVPRPYRSIVCKLGDAIVPHVVFSTSETASVIGFPIGRLEFPE